MNDHGNNNIKTNIKYEKIKFEYKKIKVIKKESS